MINDRNKLANFSYFLSLTGTATGVVILTGDRTVMGRIASLASNVGFNSTTLAKEMSHFVNIIIFIAIFMGLLFFVIAMALGYPWIVAITFLIGIICANVPEGLLSTICVSHCTASPSLSNLASCCWYQIP